MAAPKVSRVSSEVCVSMNWALESWNVLNHDLPFPVAILKESALRNNSSQMNAFLAASGAQLCPHGKSTMSPQLFERQLKDGAWGITVATSAHFAVCRRVGVKRVFLANQLVGQANIRMVMGELERAPEFEFFCLVDCIKQVDQLLDVLSENPAGRALNLLIEVGVQGGRCGCGPYLRV